MPETRDSRAAWLQLSDSSPEDFQGDLILACRNMAWRGNQITLGTYDIDDTRPTPYSTMATKLMVLRDEPEFAGSTVEALLVRQIQLLEKRIERLEAAMPEQKLVVLRDVTREQAIQEIRALFSGGETLYYSDIAERLGLSLETVVDICHELEQEGTIGVE